MDKEAQKRIEFGLRLKALIKEKRFTQASFGEKLGLAQGAIQHAIRGRSYFNFSTMVKAAEILGVSLDYLAHGDNSDCNENNQEDDVQNERIEFGLRLKSLMKDKGFTQASLGNKIGITQGALQKCLSGRNYLEFATMMKVSKILGVSLDYLAFGDAEKPHIDDAELAVLQALDEHTYKKSEEEILYLLSLVKHLQARSREEILEIVLQSFKSAIRITINRKTNEYTVTEEPNESQEIS